MGDPGHPLVARLYDPVMTVPERAFLPNHREYLAADLSGTILDVGAGTGAMFPYFADLDEGSRSLHAIEPDPHMRKQATDRAAKLGLDVEIANGSAEDLPYENDTFDTVVASLVFCTIPDVESAFDEVARVLNSGGEFRFLEHVRASGGVGAVHDVLAPGWYHAAGGCHLNRRTGDLFRADDRFELLDYRRFDSGLTGFVPLIRGRLERRPESLRSRLF